MLRVRRFAVVAALLLLLPACVGEERKIAAESRVASHWASLSLFESNSRPIVASDELPRLQGDMNILALSGGGADGAFGAGVMIGWSESGRRPQFDVVTGVSTGALQSSFVFLGPEHDKTLTDLYTCTCSQDIFASKGIAGIFSDSLLDTTPLKAKIASIVTAELLEKVADQHRRGRRLYVATTNLDAGTLSVWDMGKIAASDNPGKLELYREVLRASSAVPGFFKPVMIPLGNGDQQLHVDGGVKAPILLRSVMLNGKQRKKNVYLLVNGAMRLRAAKDNVNASVADIAKKSITELLRGLLYKTTYQAYVTVQNAGASFHLGYVPDDTIETRNPIEFDQAEMKRLFAEGRAAGLAQSFWMREPPRLENLERVRRAAAR